MIHRFTPATVGSRRRHVGVVATASACALALGSVVSLPSAHAEDPAPEPTITPIAAIQGTGDESPLLDQEVTTVGVVTASYPTGGFNGFFIQTPGTGGEKKTDGASDAIFVYPGKGTTIPSVGQCVTITGTVEEYKSMTQLSQVTAMTDQADCETVTPFTLAALPTSDTEREALEGMLVAPQGHYVVTDNYNLNRYGSLGLAFGDEPLYQATDVVAPGEEAIAYEAKNLTRAVTLDDGSNWDYSKRKEAQNSPLPYLSTDNEVRAGAQVTFTSPVIFEYRFNTWNFQPTEQVIGTKNAPTTFATTRTNQPTDVGGDVKVATFNVLNYFTSLGENEDKCKGYNDREGNPITANRCDVRGAYRAEDLQRQQEKIVAAINALDADVVSLEEIENSARYNKDRDDALKTLVTALNAAAGEEAWAYVASPATVPNNGDAIRTAFIYKPATVTPVGESLISDDKAFEKVARSPLAQRFSPVVTGNDTAQDFVVIVNHFKSKGSVLEGEGNEDAHDGQGANNAARVAQAKALAEFATKNFADLPVMMVGDFNSYTREDPMTALADAGYQTQAMSGNSYQYAGRLGSLDHVVTNDAATALLTPIAVWEINAHEPIALEYSRFNYNVTNFHRADPFRSSDHNPIIFGLNVITKADPQPGVTPDPGGDETVKPEPKPTGGSDASTSPTADGKKPGKRLVRTGAAVGSTAVVALILGAAGAAIMVARRRRHL